MHEIQNAATNQSSLFRSKVKVQTKYRKPDQIIQPWQFGDKYSKSTCLWLKNLPLLVSEEITIIKNVDSGKFVIYQDKNGNYYYKLKILFLFFSKCKVTLLFLILFNQSGTKFIYPIATICDKYHYHYSKI